MAQAVTSFVSLNAIRDSIEIYAYNDALTLLRGFPWSFGDITAALFGPHQKMLVNLLAMHLALLHLKVKVDGKETSKWLHCA